MMKLQEKDFEEIRVWMYRNARHLELTIWQYIFEKGSKDAVVSALAQYQNTDGGFGNALEADNWNPNSSPYTTVYAIDILKKINFTDGKHPLIQGIIKFFESCPFSSKNGWFLTIPSNNDYAHAPWWTYNDQASPDEAVSIGATAGIASFIIEFADSHSELYKKALRITERLIEKVKTQNNDDGMAIGGYCVLMDTLMRVELARFDCESLLAALKKLVFESIERDTAKWDTYCVRPSDYIHSPASVFYKGNEEIVQKEIDYLIKTRPQNNVWNITWSWFDNNEKYAKKFAISENWWKAAKVIENVAFLKNFNRID